jgi:hypothetical protein
MRRAQTKRNALAAVAVVLALFVAMKLAEFFLHNIPLLAYAGVVLAGIVALMVLTRSTPVKVPSLEQLRAAPAKTLVADTQVWLEAQRPALPAPALNLVGQIGGSSTSSPPSLTGWTKARPPWRRYGNWLDSIYPIWWAPIPRSRRLCAARSRVKPRPMSSWPPAWARSAPRSTV